MEPHTTNFEGKKKPVLFEPLAFSHSKVLSNRVVVAPMCQYSAVNGCATDWHLAHYLTLSNSGAGLLVFEATAVEPRGRISHGDLGLYDQETEDALCRVVRACKALGTAKLGIQIAHAGRKASLSRPWEGPGQTVTGSEFLEKKVFVSSNESQASRPLTAEEHSWECIAPSAIPFSSSWPVPREMTVEEIKEVVQMFGNTARRAVRLGFDEIELHFAHGYLAHEFLSPLSNKRTDLYGTGSRVDQFRFVLEIADAVRKVVPEHVILGARITGSDWVEEGGWTLEDATQLSLSLADHGIEFVCVSSGGNVQTRIPLGPKYQVPFAQHIKHAVGDRLRVRAVGLISQPEEAESVIAQGEADFVALARPFLHNPHWAYHAAAILGGHVERPPQYARCSPSLWKVAKY
eukprot:ANDGO_00386.mRNA.1 NADPH dehydrogenase